MTELEKDKAFFRHMVHVMSVALPEERTEWVTYYRDQMVARYNMEEQEAQNIAEHVYNNWWRLDECTIK